MHYYTSDTLRDYLAIFSFNSKQPDFRQGNAQTQRRIFIFGVLEYFKLRALMEGLRRLMSYELALHVLVTVT